MCPTVHSVQCPEYCECNKVSYIGMSACHGMTEWCAVCCCWLVIVSDITDRGHPYSQSLPSINTVQMRCHSNTYKWSKWPTIFHAIYFCNVYIFSKMKNIFVCKSGKKPSVIDESVSASNCGLGVNSSDYTPHFSSVPMNILFPIDCSSTFINVAERNF